jgi:hypothetical protein
MLAYSSIVPIRYLISYLIHSISEHTFIIIPHLILFLIISISYLVVHVDSDPFVESRDQPGLLVLCYHLLARRDSELS